MEKTQVYRKAILEGLLQKYYKRKIDGKVRTINRRVQLKATEIEKSYDSPNAEIAQKAAVNEAVKELEQRQFIVVDRLKFSEDFYKLYLAEEKVHAIEQYLSDVYGVASRTYLVASLRQWMQNYAFKGALTAFYCKKRNEDISQSSAEIHLEREKDILLALDFIQNNTEALYLREASMLIFGESKRLEREYQSVLCNILRAYHAGSSIAEDEPDAEDILSQYGILSVDQEVCLKGDFVIAFSDHVLYTKGFSGGVSIAHSDVKRIQKITVNTAAFMTIENKTAFQRFSMPTFSTLYLGGFANHHQLDFLKKVYQDNPQIAYAHFGDIDIGGFLIHETMVRQSKVPFAMYCMGVEELQNKQYASCLQPLTDSDRSRAQTLLQIPLYRPVVEYMLAHNVKLEQEIVCYSVMKQIERDGE